MYVASQPAAYLLIELTEDFQDSIMIGKARQMVSKYADMNNLEFEYCRQHLFED